MAGFIAHLFTFVFAIKKFLNITRVPSILFAIAVFNGIVLSLLLAVYFFVSSRLAVILGLAVAVMLFGWWRRFGYTALAWGPRSKLPDLTLPSGTDRIRFVCISDTHNKQQTMRVPDGDVLLHTGDFTVRGTLKEVRAFNQWLGTLPHKHKIVIAGNHDFSFDPEWLKRNAARVNSKAAASAEKARAIASEPADEDAKEGKQQGKQRGKQQGKREDPYPTDASVARQALSNATYIEHETVTVHGIRIFGSPQQPEFHEMAFNRTRGPALARLWADIPADTDILLTHSPPQNILDAMVLGTRVGCEELAKAVRRVNPKFHVFGHIHESYGVVKSGSTTFINAAICNVLYKADHAPIVFDMPRPSAAAGSKS